VKALKILLLLLLLLLSCQLLLHQAPCCAGTIPQQHSGYLLLQSLQGMAVWLHRGGHMLCQLLLLLLLKLLVLLILIQVLLLLLQQ
jgi:hypothetical protein